MTAISHAAQSYDPRTGNSVPACDDSMPEQVAAVVAAAAAATDAMAGTSPAQRQAWLDAIAAAVLADADRLCDIADEETALGLPRLSGELQRCAAALQFYGAVAVEGSVFDATIDTRRDVRPDLRRVNLPLGPVAVFGASNFPFGFGVLGHDTASGLAAGCPVVVKAHPAHPRLSAALAELATNALDQCGAPGGAFGIVFGYRAGTEIVTHPQITAVGFTGSEAGGMALWRLAATRSEYIPVYAEMGTVNTAIVTSSGGERAEEIAAGFVASFTLGMGQFCTKPGVLLAPAGYGFAARVGAALEASRPEGWLLTSGIADAYATGVEELVAGGATVVARTVAAASGWVAAPTVLSVEPSALQRGSRLLAEVFGPVALVAEYGSADELAAVLDALPGSLAVAVHGGGDDDPDLTGLVARAGARAGRVVVDGWPTGVAVTWSQHHGGPWPATTYPAASSVGAAALRRFVRPVAFQDVPDSALPSALRETNPWMLPRRVDGVIVSPAARAASQS